MSRLKMLSIAAGAIAMLAISATSASAIWVSNNGQTTGTVTVNKAGEFKYPNATVICNASEIKAQWEIHGAGQIKQQQKAAKEGPHLQLQVKNWGKGCLANTLLAVTVSECNFQLVQQEKEFTATGGVSKNTCVLKAENACTIQIPVGMETSPGSGKGINVGLKEVVLENVGSNQIDKVSIKNTGGGGQGQLEGEGIFGSASGGSCGLFGVLSSSEKGELTGLEFTAEGVKAV